MPACRSRAATAIVIMLMAALPVPTSGTAGHGDALSGPALSAARVEPAPDKLSSAELLSQDLTVYLYPENQSIAVEGSLRLRANVAITKLTMYLHETLDLLNITENGQPLLYTRNVERLTIDLSAQLAANATTNLSFHYTGTMWYLDNGKRQDCVGWEGAYVKGSTFWYLRHHASDWADYRLKFCCPPNWTAVADGELVAEEHTTEWANYTWVNDLPCLRPAFAAGNYSVGSRVAGGTNISVYTYPQHAGIATAYLDEAAIVMEYYEGILGPYGRKSFKIVETAHETMSGYACSGFVMLYPTAFSGGAVRYNLLAHESGHMWFPYATGYQGWAYPWLWEAFPEYLSCLYEMEYHGVRTRLDYDYSEYVKVHALADIRSIAASDWDTPYSSQIVYAKGAWVLRMLHGLAGTAAFNTILREYVDQNRWGYGSAQAFVAAAARHSPVRLEDFWEQWLNTTKALDVSLPVVRQYGNGTSFRLELEPANLLNGSNPADVIVEYTDGTSDILGLAWDGKAALVVLDVGRSVRQVRLDPDGWLLDIDRNNQAAVPLPSGNMFELRYASLATAGPSIEGMAMNILADISNDGRYPARDVRVDFIIDGCLTATELVEIPAQGYERATANWTPEHQGVHTLTVSVDPKNSFHEWNESNNNISFIMDIEPRPPLLDLWCGNLTIDPPAPLEGDIVVLSARVQNAGEATIYGSTVAMRLDDRLLATDAVPPLLPGEWTRVSQTWKASRGVHVLSVEAAPESALDEENLQNNRANLTFFVGWRVGLGASFSPQRPSTFEPVTFTAAGDADEFSFDFGDGASSAWGPNRTATHEYRRGGNFTVRVDGRAAGVPAVNIALTIPVRNRPPELDAWVNGVDTPTLVDVFFFARPFDLDGTVQALDWDFGDGKRAQGPNAVHQYARPGRYNATFTATDDEGASNRTVFTISARNRPPECRWTGPGQARAGESIRFEAIASDPDGNITRIKWDFGDWTCSTVMVTSHSYARAGRYNVTLHVWDEQGEEAGYSGTVVVASDEKPAVEFPAWMAIGIPMAAMTAAVALFLWRRRRVERQYDDFFQPPPRNGQNP